MVSYEGQTLSTRKGHVVYLEDLLKNAVAKARAIVEEKSPNLPDKDAVARQVGVGAVVFFDLYNNRIKDIDFWWDRALNFDGETGPYVQYTHARCCSVLRKAQEADLPPAEPDFHALSDPEAQEVVRLIEQFPAVVTAAIERSEPSQVTRFAVDLARPSTSSTRAQYLDRRPRRRDRRGLCCPPSPRHRQNPPVPHRIESPERMESLFPASAQRPDVGAVSPSIQTQQNRSTEIRPQQKRREASGMVRKILRGAAWVLVIAFCMGASYGAGWYLTKERYGSRVYYGLFGEVNRIEYSPEDTERYREDLANMLQQGDRGQWGYASPHMDTPALLDTVDRNRPYRVYKCEVTLTNLSEKDTITAASAWFRRASRRLSTRFLHLRSIPPCPGGWQCNGNTLPAAPTEEHDRRRGQGPVQKIYITTSLTVNVGEPGEICYTIFRLGARAGCGSGLSAGSRALHAHVPRGVLSCSESCPTKCGRRAWTKPVRSAGKLSFAPGLPWSIMSMTAASTTSCWWPRGGRCGSGSCGTGAIPFAKRAPF